MQWPKPPSTTSVETTCALSPLHPPLYKSSAKGPYYTVLSVQYSMTLERKKSLSDGALTCVVSCIHTLECPGELHTSTKECIPVPIPVLVVEQTYHRLSLTLGVGDRSSTPVMQDISDLTAEPESTMQFRSDRTVHLWRGQLLARSAQRWNPPLGLFRRAETSQLTLLFRHSQIELGTACGKLYRCSVMAVLDAGDSDILNREG